jgi:hypothetical protein
MAANFHVQISQARTLRMLGKLNVAAARLLSRMSQSAHGVNERRDLAPAGNRLGGVATDALRRIAALYFGFPG